MDAGNPLGLRRGFVELRDYDARWPELFRTLRAELRSALGHRVLEIEHVGSTSVPGLAAKPILDVLVGVPDLDDALSLVPELELLGFLHGPTDELPDRHYFRKGDATSRTHHLSLAEPDSRCYRNSLLFRDALRRSPRLAAEYEHLKRRLARALTTDRLAYLNGKTDFVLRVLAENGGIVTTDDYPVHGLGYRQERDRPPG